MFRNNVSKHWRKTIIITYDGAFITITIHIKIHFILRGYILCTKLVFYNKSKNIFDNKATQFGLVKLSVTQCQICDLLRIIQDIFHTNYPGK